MTLVALLAFSAVGVDTGRVAAVANEAQAAADIAALAATAAVSRNESAEAGANQVLAHNRVNGSVATNSLSALQVGHIDSDYNFDPGGTPTNAVRAEITTNVDNIVLDAIGAPVSLVKRYAIATYGGLGSGIPTLPVVIGECHFDPDCTEQPCMPYLSQVPSPSDNSGWTGFFDTASNSNVMSYMPAGPGCDGGGQVQHIKVGDIISVGNGQTTPLLRAVECAVDNGMTTFTIPIVPCNHQFNQDQEVLGFAKIEVEFVRDKNPKGIWLHGIWEGEQPGTPGGGLFGLNAISLVK